MTYLASDISSEIPFKKENIPLLLEPKKYEESHLVLIKNNKSNDLSSLEEFDSHSLETQNTMALMDRTDSKYLIPISLFAPLMQAIKHDYSILTINRNLLFNYQTTYFDDKERTFYLNHHNGKLNRYKVRYRRYVESNMGYLEVKYKNNKKRTIKTRIPMDCILPDHNKVSEFVKSSLGYSKKLSTVLFVNYQRITLINKVNKERITIDLNLSFRNAINQTQSIQDKTFIVEIKQDRKAINSPCRQYLKSLGYQPLNFGKYCIGCALTESCKSQNKPLKFNRFKSVLRQLEKTNSSIKHHHIEQI